MATARKAGGKTRQTIDPASIRLASQIPPTGSQFVGTSPTSLVDVYNGTLKGDIDAVPAAKELLTSSPDTGGKVNAEYIYSNLAALYGNVQLPPLQSPSGNSVRSLVFVSGSAQGGYGAFHLSSSQTDFDRIVADSLSSSGEYSSGSGLGRAHFSAASMREHKIPHVFPVSRGQHGLLGITDSNAKELQQVGEEDLRRALVTAWQSRAALAKSIESHNHSAVPTPIPEKTRSRAAKLERSHLSQELAQANRHVASLVGVAAAVTGGRTHLSTALYCAELVESFELLTGKGDAGKTDGEAVSRVVSFKLAPEIALVPGFNAGVTQDWWANGHPDFVNDNSQDDQSENGNASGVMFLLFLNDFLGISLQDILAAMPATNGAPLGQTYEALVSRIPNLVQIGGGNGAAAFATMINLLQQNAQSSDGSLNLPANGNPFPNMPNSKQGGLFTS
jgi:hypothetical protein